MDIISSDERYAYYHMCDKCNSELRIYPNDVIESPYDTIHSTLNRRIHTRCPVCGEPLIMYLDDTPCFFKQIMARKRGWKTNE